MKELTKNQVMNKVVRLLKSQAITAIKLDINRFDPSLWDKKIYTKENDVSVLISGNEKGIISIDLFYKEYSNYYTKANALCFYKVK